MAATACPTEDRLRLLLSAAGAGADEADLVAHLDRCTECQYTLERLSGATQNILGVARVVGTKPDTQADEASLQRMLHDLESNASATVLAAPSSQNLSSPIRGRAALPEALNRLDGYQVTGTLGHGAMGQVLAAFEPALHRKVAIKILAANLASDPLARERFAREARAAAAVKHEHVVTIHAVREVEGLPYLVMEYVAGGSLQDYLEKHGPPDWHEAARLGAEVAEGLAAAHAAGLIHRDIKPSNILLEPSAPAGDGPGTAKIADFGLARIGDESRLTESGILAGTPMYMAPEQALGDPLDHRTDLFSLGSVLYTLLTGTEPFQGNNPMAVLRQVCETTPTPVRQLKPAVPIWLAAVVARLHARRPANRFASASEVADILRFNLAHPDHPRPVPKAPPSRRKRTTMRWLIAALCLGLLLLAGLALGWRSWGTPHETEHREEGQLSLRATLRGHTGPIWAVAFSPDGQTLVTGSADTTLRFWDPRTGRSTAVLSGKSGAILSVSFARQGAAVVAGRGDGTLHVWNTLTHSEQRPFPHVGGNARRLAVSPDGKTVAVCSNAQGVELWDFDRRGLRRDLPGQAATLLAIAYAPDGKTLATGDTSGQVCFYQPDTGAEIGRFAGDTLGLRTLAFSPDGKTLATAGTGDRDVKLWEVESRRLITTLPGYEDVVVRLAFSPGGKRLATAGRDGTLKVWDVASGQALASMQAHQASIWSLAFSPDGQTLATVGDDRLGKLWDMGQSADAP